MFHCNGSGWDFGVEGYELSTRAQRLAATTTGNCATMIGKLLVHAYFPIQSSTL